MTVTLFGAILWAWRAPSPDLEKSYFRAFFWVTVILETMRRLPAMNQWTKPYLFTYWVLIAYVSVFLPGKMIYFRRLSMLTELPCVLLAAWLSMGVYYVGYFRDWHSARLDWMPQVIYIVAFFIFGLAGRFGNPQPTPRRHGPSSNTLTPA